MVHSILRQFKNSKYDEVENIVRDATSSESVAEAPTWDKVARACTSYGNYEKMLNRLWKRIMDVKYHIHVIKGLELLEYLLHTSKMQHQLVYDCKRRMRDLNTLLDYQSSKGSSLGGNVREAVGRIKAFIIDFDESTPVPKNAIEDPLRAHQRKRQQPSRAAASPSPSPSPLPSSPSPTPSTSREESKRPHSLVLPDDEFKQMRSRSGSVPHLMSPTNQSRIQQRRPSGTIISEQPSFGALNMDFDLMTSTHPMSPPAINNVDFSDLQAGFSPPAAFHPPSRGQTFNFSSAPAPSATASDPDPKPHKKPFTSMELRRQQVDGALDVNVTPALHHQQQPQQRMQDPMSSLLGDDFASGFFQLDVKPKPQPKPQPVEDEASRQARVSAELSDREQRMQKYLAAEREKSEREERERKDRDEASRRREMEEAERRRKAAEDEERRRREAEEAERRRKAQEEEEERRRREREEEERRRRQMEEEEETRRRREQEERDRLAREQAERDRLARAQQAPQTPPPSLKLSDVMMGEVMAYAHYFNQCLGDGGRTVIIPSAPQMLPMMKDGHIMARFLNYSLPDAIDLRVLNPNTTQHANEDERSREWGENLQLVIAAAKALGVQAKGITSEKILRADVDSGCAVSSVDFIWQNIRQQLLRESKGFFDNEQLVQEMGLSAEGRPESVLVAWLRHNIKPVGLDDRSHAYSACLHALLAAIKAKSEGRPFNSSTYTPPPAAQLAAGVVTAARQMGVKFLVPAKLIDSGNPRLKLAFLASIFNRAAELESQRLERLSSSGGSAVSSSVVFDANAASLLKPRKLKGDASGLSDAQEEEAFRMWINSLELVYDPAKLRPHRQPKQTTMSGLMSEVSRSRASSVDSGSDDTKEAVSSSSFGFAADGGSEGFEAAAASSSSSAPAKPTASGAVDIYIHRLFHDLRDGLVLLTILNHIQPGLVNWNKVELYPNGSRFKMVANCNYAVSICQSLGFSLVGTQGSDITDGNPKLTLGLVWQLMRFHIITFLKNLRSDTSNLKLRFAFNDQPQQQQGSGPLSVSSLGMAVGVDLQQLDKKDGLETLVMQWANNTIAKQAKANGQPSHSVRQAKNFHDPVMRDGLFLLDLLYAVNPRLVQWHNVYTSINLQGVHGHHHHQSLSDIRGSTVESKQQSARDQCLLNARYAINVARKLGCTIFVTPSDIVDVKSKMLLTLVAGVMSRAMTLPVDANVPVNANVPVADFSSLSLSGF